MLLSSFCDTVVLTGTIDYGNSDAAAPDTALVQVLDDWIGL